MENRGFTLMELINPNVASVFLSPALGNNGKKNGFTLIELMIVIAIIAILASVLVPNFAKSKERAQLEACKSNIRQIAVAMEMYAGDNNGFHTPYTDYAVHYSFSANYLTPDYIKTIPTCPTGHTYTIAANCPTGYYSAHNPSPADLVLSMCGPGSGMGIYENAHPGLSRWCPQYVIGGGILLKY